MPISRLKNLVEWGITELFSMSNSSLPTRDRKIVKNKSDREVITFAYHNAAKEA